MPGCCRPTHPSWTPMPCSPTGSWTRSGRHSPTARCARRRRPTSLMPTAPTPCMAAPLTRAAPRPGRSWRSVPAGR
eukprot:55408-Alexandrium_andersonii.AAC.1